MPQVLACNDVVPGCPAVVRAESEEEVLRQAAEHARSAHGIQQLDAQTVQAVRAAIRPASSAS